MKRFLFTLITLIAVLFPSGRPSDACVGKVLYIGISNSSGEQLFAEMLSLLINERTGTTVSIRVYRDSQEMYQAVKKGEVSILIENTGHALELLGRPPEENTRKAYVISKRNSEKASTWYGSSRSGCSILAPAKPRRIMCLLSRSMP